MPYDDHDCSRRRSRSSGRCAPSSTREPPRNRWRSRDAGGRARARDRAQPAGAVHRARAAAPRAPAPARAARARPAAARAGVGRPGQHADRARSAASAARSCSASRACGKVSTSRVRRWRSWWWRSCRSRFRTIRWSRRAASVSSERGIDPFRADAVPEAVLRFRQGVGRLIRRADDRGVLVVCDPRLVSASYRRPFLEALPVAPSIVRDARELGRRGRDVPSSSVVMEEQA